MAGQMQLTFFFAIITLYCISNTVSLEREQNVSEINLDKAVDNLLPVIHKFILNKGLDPLDLVDFSVNIFPYLPAKLKGNIDMRNGWLQNLSQLYRTGSVNVKYENKFLILNMNFGFDILDFTYEYSLEHLLYKRQGDVYGCFYNLDVNTVITIDLVNYYLNFESIKFSKVRKYDIKFKGHILDDILNILTKLVTSVFHKHILTHIEDRSMMICAAKINEWNKTFSRLNRMEIIEKWLHMSKA